MTVRTLTGLAVGDFRERVRRPVYAVTLLAAVGLGRLAVPDADSRWGVIDVGGNRGVYNSAWVGTATALAGALWLTVGGFYVVRGAIVRDDTTGVGQVLAATPLRSAGYLAAKFLSNLLVLASMLGVLAGTALVRQLLAGEDRSVDPVALLAPFLLIALPVLAVAAAAAVLFETVPPLRAGFGNVLWFGPALLIAIGGQSAHAPFGGLGVQHAVPSLRRALEEQQLAYDQGGFSIGLTETEHPLHPFRWDGAPLTGGFLLARLALFLLAAAAAVLPALWFGRFDRTAGRPKAAEGKVEEQLPWKEREFMWLPGTVPVRAGAFGRLLAGEARILVQGVPRTWWTVVAGLSAAVFAVPERAVGGLLLPVLWLWPVLLWSRLGSQQAEHGLAELLGAHPAPRRRLLAEWAAGVLLTALTGLAPLLRMLAAGDGAGAAHWLGGPLLVPSLALALGVVSRGHRLFQALYLPLWYLLVNRVAAVDFMGAARTAGHPDGPHPLLVAALSAALLAAAALAAEARRGRAG
ncbi:hypothetical protein OU787_27045 [Kitasatospora sp. YST-16]|uniref:hypothetical protein n=1 Tax=Kitasatospora sp. YST-16 TaxID=2998080 RepID=UPI0022834142|nr:hypothetical protein OU787_27045 [Kitasatospora sp. YST-16]